MAGIHDRATRRAFFWALASGVGLVAVGCGGGGGTPFEGNYAAQLPAAHSRIVVLSMKVRNASGNAAGTVYVYREDAARGRHGGAHALIAQGPVTGNVDPDTRDLELSGTVTNTDGEGGTVPVLVTGKLKRSASDLGSLTIVVDAFEFIGAFR